VFAMSPENQDKIETIDYAIRDKKRVIIFWTDMKNKAQYHITKNEEKIKALETKKMNDTIDAIFSTKIRHGKTCKVKIERSTEYHPYKKQRLQIGKINLRGSVFYASGTEKHLQTLYRVDPIKSEYRNWYA
jgi:hypothetical protein